MASINLIEAFQEFKDAESIDRPTMMKVVEDVFKTLLRKKYGSDENFDVIVNAEKGDLEIIRRREIRPDDDVDNPLAEVSYSKRLIFLTLVVVLSLLQSKHWHLVSMT